MHFENKVEISGNDIISKDQQKIPQQGHLIFGGSQIMKSNIGSDPEPTSIVLVT